MDKLTAVLIDPIIDRCLVFVVSWSTWMVRCHINHACESFLDQCSIKLFNDLRFLPIAFDVADSSIPVGRIDVNPITKLNKLTFGALGAGKDYTAFADLHLDSDDETSDGGGKCTFSRFLFSCLPSRCVWQRIRSGLLKFIFSSVEVVSWTFCMCIGHSEFLLYWSVLRYHFNCFVSFPLFLLICRSLMFLIVVAKANLMFFSA